MEKMFPSNAHLIKPLGIHDKLKLVRKRESVEGVASPPAVVKKSYNIPICDVVEQHHDEIVKPTFELPENYIRHVRRFGDEADITVDCNMDADDKMWLSKSKFATDKEMKALTVDAFEIIINILERHTGLSRDPIPQSHADRLVSETLKWTPTLTAKLLPEVYNYWLRKRERLRKPLCRKYWPQTPATDNNPHLTFRPRDKERYRLRKQLRRNDIESFRKMQQLRREFSHAIVLLELIMEREDLKKAALELQREAFEQELYDTGPALLSSGDVAASSAAGAAVGVRPLRRLVPFKHSLQYEHHQLIPQQDGDQSFKVELNVGSTAGGGRERTNQQSNRAQNQAAQQQKKAEAEARRQRRLATTNLQQQRRKRDDYGYERGAASDGAEAHELMHPSMPGPGVFLRSHWSAFMLPAPVSDHVRAPRSVSEYLDELELRENEPLPTKFRCRLRLARGGRVVMDRVPVYPVSAATAAAAASAAAVLSCEPPGTGMGTGSGGSWAGDLGPLFQGSYLYPTVLQSRVLRGAHTSSSAASASASTAATALAAQAAASAASGAGTGTVSAAGSVGAGVGPGAPGGSSGVGRGGAGVVGGVNGGGEPVKTITHRQLYTLPPTLPPERAAILHTLVHRERDIYQYSDSEDEAVDVLSVSRAAHKKQSSYSVLKV